MRRAIWLGITVGLLAAIAVLASKADASEPIVKPQLDAPPCCAPQVVQAVPKESLHEHVTVRRIKPERAKVVVIKRPKPGFILFVSQCGRPLVIYGVDSASYFYSIDATTLNQAQLEAIASEVDAAHRTIKDMPCVGNHRHETETNL
jgi:hypothetical protein